VPNLDILRRRAAPTFTVGPIDGISATSSRAVVPEIAEGLIVR
jgi:hypothetical protein